MMMMMMMMITIIIIMMMTLVMILFPSERTRARNGNVYVSLKQTSLTECCTHRKKYLIN